MPKHATIPRGTVVLVPFPFTDLTAIKVRPAVVVSANNNRGNDVIAVFISSNISRKIFSEDLRVADVSTLRTMGLKVPSVVRCRKIVTLDRSIIIGELGQTPKEILTKIEKCLRSILGLA